jgi:hypothetical protein
MAVPYLLSFGWGQRYKIKNTSHKEWYKSIEAKKAAVEKVPRRLKAEGKVSSLVGWRYIRQALNALPS